MSVRGRGGRGRGGRPRGGKTTIWTWEDYKPSAEIYNALHRPRNAAPIITPNLPDKCPLSFPYANSRILDRQTTNDDFHEIFYRVLVRKPSTNSDFDSKEVIGKPHGEDSWTEQVEDVHVSRILQYVSAREFERFENAEFGKEAEAEAAVRQAEMEEKIAKRLEKNARVPSAGKGSRMLSGLDLRAESAWDRSVWSSRGGRGRPRGRGRGRGRGGGRGQGGALLGSMLSFSGSADQGEPLDDNHHFDGTQESEEHAKGSLARDVEELSIHGPVAQEPEVPETDEEMEVDSPESTSPIMRSSFVAYSALPASPLQTFRGQPEVPDIDESDTASMSSTALQLQSEQSQCNDTHGQQWESVEVLERPFKRRRTESVFSASKGLPKDSPESYTRSKEMNGKSATDTVIPETQNAKRESFTQAVPEAKNERDIEEQEDDEEEFVIEKIMGSKVRHGVRSYLVKWEGYDDHHPDAKMWLPASELVNAPEMVADYHAKVQRMKGKRPVRR